MVSIYELLYRKNVRYHKNFVLFFWFPMTGSCSHKKENLLCRFSCGKNIRDNYDAKFFVSVTPVLGWCSIDWSVDIMTLNQESTRPTTVRIQMGPEFDISGKNLLQKFRKEVNTLQNEIREGFSPPAFSLQQNCFDGPLPTLMREVFTINPLVTSDSWTGSLLKTLTF